MVEKQATELGWSSTRYTTHKKDDHYSTDYALVTQNKAFLSANPSQVDKSDPVLDVPLWTDRYHNLFEILKK